MTEFICNSGIKYEIHHGAIATFFPTKRRIQSPANLVLTVTIDVVFTVYDDNDIAFLAVAQYALNRRMLGMMEKTNRIITELGHNCVDFSTQVVN